MVLTRVLRRSDDTHFLIVVARSFLLRRGGEAKTKKGKSGDERGWLQDSRSSEPIWRAKGEGEHFANVNQR